MPIARLKFIFGNVAVVFFDDFFDFSVFAERNGTETVLLLRDISYLVCGRICVFNTLRFFDFKHFFK